MRYSKLDEDQKARLLLAYQAGILLHELATEYGIATSTIRTYVRQAGLPLRHYSGGGQPRRYVEGGRVAYLPRLLQLQSGYCGICGCPDDGAFEVDHDHQTGLIRGALCLCCNRYTETRRNPPVDWAARRDSYLQRGPAMFP